MTTNDKMKEVAEYLNSKYGYVESRDIRFHKTADAWVDFSYLERHESGTNKGRINWKCSAGNKIPFSYKNVNGELILERYDKEELNLYLSYNKKQLKPISITHIIYAKIGSIIGVHNRDISHEEFVNLMKDVNCNIEIVGNFTKISNKVDCRCKVCNHEWNPVAAKILHLKQGCPSCSNKVVNSYDCRNAIYYTEPNVVKYIKNKDDAFKYTRNSDKDIEFICDCCEHYEFKTISNVVNQGFSCSMCSDGIKYPNKFICSMIKQLSEHYSITNIKREFNETWTNGKKYDIYFEFKGVKYIVEMDGYFHKEDNHLSGQTKEVSIEIDLYKDKIAKNNNINVIRIDCNYIYISKRHDYIKNNILNSCLSNIFDLSKINWEDVEKASVSSIQQKAWKLRKENPNMTTKEIAHEIGVDQNTVRAYLVRGHELKMCHYIGKEDSLKANGKGIVYVFKDGKLLNEKPFSSAREVGRSSVDFIGEKLDHTVIGKRLNGVNYGEHSKEYKGFTFVRIPYGSTLESFENKVLS